MKRHVFYNPLLVLLVAACLLVIAVGSQGQDNAKGQAGRGQPLVVVLSPALDGPTFAIDYKNRTEEAIDEMELLGNSSLVLDGREYERVNVAGTGSWRLEPGQTETYTFTLRSYMPAEKFERKKYSEELKRWRWKPLLPSGKHTASVTFGGVQYGPVTFIWKGDVPYLHE